MREPDRLGNWEALCCARVQKVMQPAALSHTHQSHSTLEHSHYAHGHTSASRRSSRTKPHRYSQRST